MKTAAFEVMPFSVCYPIILLLFLQVQLEYVEAKTRECDNNKFGYECRFQCRCKNNMSCNVTNGICPSGCADGFWGSNCQLSNECYYNGHQEKYEGTKSVAHESSTCLKWRNEPHNYCRPYRGDRKPWCYTYYRWYYCKLNDCKCPPGLFGINCIKECHCKNASEVCNPYSGSCDTCGPGWKGNYCREKCESGTFGDNCQQKCHCTEISQCRRTDECESGTFGDNCQQKCHCVEISQCRRTDGKCLYGGCVPGYVGENCQKECDFGTFGSGCHQKCHCANNSQCSITDGKCLDNICAAGYIGQNCQKSCPVGKFGENCQKVCQCKNHSACNKTDGRCADNKCKFGYRGPKCHQRYRNHRGKKSRFHIRKHSAFIEKCQEVCQCKNPSLYDNADERCADSKCKFGYRGPKCDKSDLTTIILLLLIPLLILIGIIIGITFYLKKRKSNKTIDCDELNSVDNASMSQIEQLNLAYDENETENIYQNTLSLAKDNILLYIERNKMEEEPFASEFSRLPQGLIFSHEAGVLDENAKKNRYKTLVPYDYSRVVLLPDEVSSSDYINASYITEGKKYIATQGPISGTTNDFWRMIWQEKCNTIIMLTDMIENCKLKCVQYWPDLNHTETYGKFKIHCVQEKKFMIYTYRLLSINRTSNLSQEECFVDHFQCRTWPDHDVPKDPIYFIEFRNKIRHMKSSKAPYVVHCSAGVGRTGTYIALDILLEKLWKNSTLDVFSCVNELRQQRPLMVHRKCQYQFIYDVLAEDVLTGLTEVATEFIPTEFRRMLRREVDEKSPLLEQYENLLLPLGEPSKTLPDQNESIYKNVGKNNDGDNTDDDSLQTAYLDGFTMINEIILTNQPSEKLAEDFWNIVFQKRCTAIIMFEDLFNSVSAYWPDEQKCPKHYGNIVVELMCLNETETSFQRQFKVSSSEKDTIGGVMVNHFQSKIWLNNPPPSQTEIIEFIQTVSGYIKPQKQILVHSQDNFSKSGLFSLLYVMIQGLKNDPYTSILRLVRRMKKKNANIVVDYRSYEYCWMVANVFLGELSIYSNI